MPVASASSCCEHTRSDVEAHHVLYIRQSADTPQQASSATRQFKHPASADSQQGRINGREIRGHWIMSSHSIVGFRIGIEPAEQQILFHCVIRAQSSVSEQHPPTRSKQLKDEARHQAKAGD